MKARFLLFVLALMCATSSAIAQGRQSGTLGGRLVSSDKLALPGATVTVSSPALQGVRSTVTDINGVFSLPGLPPGEYIVKFEMSGMSSVERRAAIPLGGVVTMEQMLAIAPIREVVVVEGARPAAISSPAGAFNLRADQFALLPLPRTPYGLAEFAPGL